MERMQEETKDAENDDDKERRRERTQERNTQNKRNTAMIPEQTYNKTYTHKHTS